MYNFYGICVLCKSLVLCGVVPRLYTQVTTSNIFSIKNYNGKVMSRDVPICNVLAICREVLNCENLEVLHIGKCFISWDALFYDCNNILQNEGLKKDQIFYTQNSRQYVAPTH